MLAFAFSRALQAIPVVLVVGLIAFALFAYVGDPVLIMLGQEHTEAQRKLLVEQLGLDQPFYVQYVRYIWAVLHGQLGISYSFGRPVAQLIAGRLPATLELASVAAVFAVIPAIPLGLFSAIRPRNLLSRGILLVSLLGVSAPTFMIGLLLILGFSVALGWFPSFGRGQVVQVGRWWTTGLLTGSGLRAIVLPALTLGSVQMSFIVRLMRAEIIRALQADYIRFARARGLPERSLYCVHVCRNALLPVVTAAGLQLGNVLAFSVVTETVFQWPGLGLLFISAVRGADIPVMSAYLMLAGLGFVAINLSVDLAYHAIDPRLRIPHLGASSES
ncbi:MAG: ABC transporter permease [Acetobacteraceae bacterium]|nr:ABC transporter permease [Acetobacteraceae bacterium]